MLSASMYMLLVIAAMHFIADAIRPYATSDSSYAFHCARVHLNQKSVEFLNSPATTDEISFPIFRSRFEFYTDWLSDEKFQDISEDGLSFRDLPFSF